ncbi:MAG: DUF2141 domain-containing protein [Sphingobacteriaceae bacterium]|nr:MAG: DUF2141 domain-containing protein [Sphingobacteriaceae bacterium]
MLTISYAHAQETQINITGIKSVKGKIVLSLFKNSQAFDKEQPYKSFVFDKNDLVNGALTVTIKVETGTYGIALLDDENSNGKMDKSFIGIPKEGFGFSDFYLEKLKKPAFDDFKVDLKAAHNKVAIRVKYL